MEIDSAVVGDMSTEQQKGVAMWIEESLHQAAQCWCDKRTETREMDSVLATVFAEKLAAWMDTAAQNQRNADYYRGLLDRCGEAIGESAYIAEDGTKSQDVLYAKIPEIIENNYLGARDAKAAR